MKEIIIKTVDQEYSAIIVEVPSKLKIKGQCTVLKIDGKYSIKYVILNKPIYRIEAIGYRNCTHMVGGMCYNNQKRLGTINNPVLIDCLRKQIEL